MRGVQQIILYRLINLPGRILHRIMGKIRPRQLRLIIIIDPGPLTITIILTIYACLFTHGQVPGVYTKYIVLTGLDVVWVVLLLW